MAALFPRWTNTAARASLLAAACALVGLPVALMAWVRTPNATRRYQPVTQPIAFDHRVHVTGQRIDCRYCHYSADRSASAGIPPSSMCVPCHSASWMRTDVMAPVRTSVASGKPLQWNRVYALPGFVYFNHAIHVTKGVGCETCHGRVDQMASVYQAAPLSMQWCVSCHRDPAEHLRPVGEVTTMGWTPPVPQRQLGEALVREHRVQQLTNCTTCHR
jgi:hypothetical protein